MQYLPFPFWVVTVRRGSVAVQLRADQPHSIAAFTTAPQAAKFAVEHGETAFESLLVSRATFLPLAMELLRCGVQTLYLDPDTEGRAGYDLATAAARLSWPEVDTQQD